MLIIVHALVSIFQYIPTSHASVTPVPCCHCAICRCLLLVLLLSCVGVCGLWRRWCCCCWTRGGSGGGSCDDEAEASSERESAISCYPPPQYSRCSSFHHAPPPYTEVKFIAKQKYNSLNAVADDQKSYE